MKSYSGDGGVSVKREADWAMIRSIDIGVDVGGDDAIGQVRCGEEVVNPPANVALAGVAPVCPPTVGAFLIRVEMTEGIDVSLLDDLVDPGAFDGQEAGGVLVLLGAGEVDLAMSSIHIPAKDDLLS